MTLIAKLRIVGELEILRETHEKMNKLFPLSPQIWLDWIEDETKVAWSDDQKIGIISLYNRAVGEYLNSKIWSSFIQYSVELNENNLLTHETIREIFNQALNHLGCSVLDGALVFRQYRLFELFELNKFGSLTGDNLEQINKQIKIVYDLYHRQFSLPLLEMKEDYEQFKQWLDQINNNYGIDLRQNKSEFSRLVANYEKSLKTLESLEKYEEKIRQSNSPHLEEYIEYIDFEIKNDNFPRTKCLFERSITENCLQPDLWLKYLKFCDSKMVVESFLFPIYERATRNCPWIAKIWIQYIQATERICQNDDIESLKNKIFSILKQALTCTLIEDHKDIWITYLNFLRRTICRINGWNDEKQIKIFRETFEGAIKSLEDKFNFEYCYDLYRYYSKIEAKYLKNIEIARDIWKKLIDNSPSFRRQVINLI